MREIIDWAGLRKKKKTEYCLFVQYETGGDLRQGQGSGLFSEAVPGAWVTAPPLLKKINEQGKLTTREPVR